MEQAIRKLNVNCQSFPVVLALKGIRAEISSKNGLQSSKYLRKQLLI
jgi:hypothetical protein